jgi:hypothetical protein
VNNNVNVGGMYVFVLLDEMGSDNGSENFWLADCMLLGKDENGIFNRVCGNNGSIICFCIAKIR